MMSSLKPREKKILLAAAVLAGLFFLDRLTLQTWQTEAGSLSQRLSREEVSLARERHLIENRDDIMRRHKNLFRKAAAPSPEDEVTALLGEIETLARKCRVSLTDMKPRTDTRDSAFSVAIQVEGGWRAFSKFLLSVEESPSLLKVDKGTLRLKGRHDSLIDAQLTIRRVQTSKTSRV